MPPVLPAWLPHVLSDLLGAPKSKVLTPFGIFFPLAKYGIPGLSTGKHNSDRQGFVELGHPHLDCFELVDLQAHLIIKQVGPDISDKVGTTGGFKPITHHTSLMLFNLIYYIIDI